MKIQSNLPFNTSLIASHKALVEGGSAANLVGSTLPNVLRIPAGSTIQLDDDKWEQFAKAAKSHIAKGDLVLIEAPKLDAVAQAEADDKLEASLRAQMGELKARRDAADETAEG